MRCIPAGLDVVPPVVAVHGAVGGWRNVPVAVTFTGADGAGSGVAYTELSTDDGLSWYKAGGVVVEAPIDHSNDGVHLVQARAVDNAGNVSRVRATRVRIDTEGPTTEAWATDWRPWGPRGRHYVVIGFQVHDRTPRVRCQLVIRSAATGRVALRRNLGWRTTSEWAWWEDDYADVMFDRSLLAKGTYDVRIGGFTHDVAGNRLVEGRVLGAARHQVSRGRRAARAAPPLLSSSFACAVGSRSLRHDGLPSNA